MANVLQITLESARVNKKLTQEQAAELLGVAVGTLRNWENGVTYPNQPQIERICEVYELSYDNIIF